ncbi:hypothetical protein HNR49_002367 [Halobacterium salinarum]|uniref:Uncharacterized protein n=1 Tax=Halobacterium salinarum TaxID=2242 RepID=A0A841HD45_HALSI|nr:hypothetical protein [Halobacterium salinarum]
MEPSKYQYEHYVTCEDEDDPRWHRCTLCNSKIYVSDSKPLDSHRRE